MPIQTPLPKDHPMMLAWNAYQGSAEYANSFKWAAMEEHRDGSMWAAFCAGYESAKRSVNSALDQAGLMMAMSPGRGRIYEKQATQQSVTDFENGVKEMEYSIAHKHGMNPLGEHLYPDGRVPWGDATPPNLNENITTGRLRHCGYCGSMHPSDVAAAIRAGARGSWADMKYGWPHKSYFTDIPNPHAGLLESRASANFKDREDWIQVDENHWREPGRPAAPTTDGKFYTVHLMDATPDERKIIEEHLGLNFEFTDDGKVSWRKVDPQ